MKLIYSIAIGLLVLLGGCAGNPPVIDYDPSANFASWKTYAFISDHPLFRAPDSPPGSPLLEGRLMQITDDTLQQKGFVKVDDPEQADFAISFTVGARDKIQVHSYPEPYRPYYGAWGWGGPYYAGAPRSSVDVQQYTEGTLAIDIYDVAEHDPAWHGVATKRITDSMRRNPTEALTEIVNSILADFPPGVASP